MSATDDHLERITDGFIQRRLEQEPMHKRSDLRAAPTEARQHEANDALADIADEERKHVALDYSAEPQ